MKILNKVSLFMFIIALMLGIPTLTLAMTEINLSTADDLVKAVDNKTVYWVNDGKRFDFPTQTIYNSWYGNDFSTIETISDSQLASYILTANVGYKPGTVLKVASAAKVYLVADNGTLRWITNEYTFYTMGFSFSQVKDLPESFFSNYQLGDNI